MFNKPLAEVSYDDLQNIIEVQKTEEGVNLDYKKEIGSPDRAKKELAKDVSAFANSQGGYLIIGVSNDKQILGIDKLINGRPVIEWINQILSTNVTPTIIYQDPKQIEIPNTDRVVIVIHIPESMSKPHMLTEEYSYYIRINDSSKPANHYLVRDMFEYNRNRSNDIRELLVNRNINDDKSQNFAQNQTSTLLSNREVRKLHKSNIPLVLFSIIPKNLSSIHIDEDTSELLEWLKQNNKQDIFDFSLPLFHVHYNIDTSLDGFRLSHYSNNLLKSYFEVLENGYIEAGLSESFLGSYGHQTFGAIDFLHLTSVLAYEYGLLKFTKEFYAHIGYYDEVLFQLSLANVKNFSVEGLFNHNSTVSFYSKPTNQTHENIKLTATFSPQKLTENKILDIIEHHSRKLSNGFGYQKNVGLVNRKLDKSQINFFQL